jgi:hypothetical protein
MSRLLRAGFLLAAATCALACAALLADGPTSAGKKYALLVGVKEYEHSALTNLRYTENDVTELAKLLEANGYEVVVLTAAAGKENPKRLPTKANIERAMRALLDGCKRNDTVLIGLAGHGLQFADQDDCYFCPLDAKPFKDKAQTLVSLNAVYEELRKCGAGSKLLLVDACRNDPSPDRGRGIDNDNAPSPPKGVGVLFSCSAGERAYEPDDLKHGVFFYYVLEGLRGEAKDPKDDEVTWDTLRAYVKKQVARELPKWEKGKQQHPQEKGELSGASPVLIQAVQGGKPRLVKPVRQATDKYSSIRDIAFDSKGQRLVVACRGQVKEDSPDLKDAPVIPPALAVWDMGAGKLLNRYTIKSGLV